MPFSEFHPLFIHFPIALLSTAILFDCIYFITDKQDLEIAGRWTMLTGLLSAAGGIATGILADTKIGHFGSVLPIWNNHGWIQVFSIVIFTLLFIWRSKKGSLPKRSDKKWTYLFLGVMAVITLFYGSHLGAKLANRI